MVMSLSDLGLVLSFALVVLLPLGHTQMWDCEEKFDECSNMYDSGSQDCSHYNSTIYCFGDVIDHCFNYVLFSALMRNTTIKDRYCKPSSQCSNQPLHVCVASFFPSLDPPTPSPPPNCTYVPPLPPLDPVNSPLDSLGSPSLLPPPTPSDCTLPDYQTNYRQHCSIFSLSHIRPFGDRSLPLQTCKVFGKSYLLKHESLSVSIKGEHKMGNSANFTFISEVNVTLHRHKCFQQTVTYTATTVALSESIPGFAASDSSLLKLTVENQTAATILAPWINSSIIIRRIDGYLSVTIQVPEPLAREDDVTGLCSIGCAADFQVSDDDFELPEYRHRCPQNRVDSSIMCLSLGITPPLQTESDTLYPQLCTYDLMLTHDTNLLSLYWALGEDAERLPDVTQITPTDPATSPDTPMSSPTSATPPRTVIINTGGVVSSALPTAPLPLLLIYIVTISQLLLLR